LLSVIKGLVDQWLDIINCDLEPTVGAVFLAVGGREVDNKKIHEDLNKFLGFVDQHLNGKKFLVGNSITIADISLATNLCALCCHALGQEERKQRTHLISWWTSICEQTKGSLGECKLTEKAHGSLSCKEAPAE
jgi:glutathione S-transferase